MRPSPATIRALLGDPRGQVTVEWTLLLAVVGLPTIYGIFYLVNAIADHYAFIAFMETLPFP